MHNANVYKMSFYQFNETHHNRFEARQCVNLFLLVKLTLFSQLICWTCFLITIKVIFIAFSFISINNCAVCDKQLKMCEELKTIDCAVVVSLFFDNLKFKWRFCH